MPTRAERALLTTTRLLLAAAVIAMCWRLGGHALLEPDEGRNVEVAREMARSGDFVLPHLNGLPYLDKPAPYFAAVALSLRLFGESEGAARAASLLFTLGSIAVVWLLARRLGPPVAGELSALALATMPLVLAFSRTVIFDPMLAFVETFTLFAAWRALEGSAGTRRWAALAWAAMGLGAITKGPVAVIVPLLVLAGFAVAARTTLRPLFRWNAWPWFFVVGLPWFVAVSLRRPDFPRYAFIYESLERMATKTHGRGGPFWYFVPIALAGSFPWCVPAIAAAAAAWRARARRRDFAARSAVFLLSWALVPLVFFSLSQSKLPGYYLPALPAWALGAGLLLARAAHDEGDDTFRAASAARVAGFLLLAVAAVLLIGVHVPAAARTLTADEREALPVFGIVLAGVYAVAGALALDGGRNRRVGMMAMALALPVVAVPFAGARLLHAVGLQRSSVELAQAIENDARGATVVGVAAWPTSLRYYLDRPVLLSSATGAEMTSNYVVSRAEEFRGLALSPLRPADWWREALDQCAEPMVFVARRRSAADSLLKARLPLIAEGGADGKFAAYGPCAPPAHSAGQGDGGTAGRAEATAAQPSSSPPVPPSPRTP